MSTLQTAKLCNATNTCEKYRSIKDRLRKTELRMRTSLAYQNAYVIGIHITLADNMSTK
jgi:hypothetical protein